MTVQFEIRPAPTNFGGDPSGGNQLTDSQLSKRNGRRNSRPSRIASKRRDKRSKRHALYSPTLNLWLTAVNGKTEVPEKVEDDESADEAEDTTAATGSNLNNTA